ALSDQEPARSTAGSCRSAARSRRSSQPGRARRNRSTSLPGSARLAGARLSSTLLTSGSSGSGVPLALPATSARTTAANERGATSTVQSDKACSWQARCHLLRPVRAGPDSMLGAVCGLCSTCPSTTWTEQVPQVPRPPQAPTIRTPLRRALWNKVSPACAVMTRSRCANRTLCPGGTAAARVFWVMVRELPWSGRWPVSSGGGRGKRPRAHAALLARAARVAARPGACGQVDTHAQHHRGRLQRVHDEAFAQADVDFFRAGQTQHGSLCFQRQPGITGAQLAAHGEAAAADLRLHAILGAARDVEQQLVPQFVQRHSERDAALREQLAHAPLEPRAEGACAAG